MFFFKRKKKAKTPQYKTTWNLFFHNNILNTHFNVIFSNDFYYLY